MAVAKQGELLHLLSGKREAPQCILIHGADNGAVIDLCQAVARKVTGGADALSVTRLTEAQVLSSPDRLYSEFAARSMFGDRLVVWISASGDSLAKALEPILSSREAGNLILIDSENLSKTSKLRKLCEADKRSLACALYEESLHELRQRLERQIRAGGHAISDEAMERLMQLVSRERIVGESEVAKLLTFAHGSKQITVDDVVAVCGDTHDSGVDELLDAVFEGQMAAADRHLVTLQAQGSGKAVLPMAMQHVAKLQALSLQMRQGQSVGETVSSKRNGIFFKRQPSISRQLQLWSLESLLDADARLADATLATRQMPALEDSLVSRSLLALGWQARSFAE